VEWTHVAQDRDH